jgi:hypothetical protein
MFIGSSNDLCRMVPMRFGLCESPLMSSFQYLIQADEMVKAEGSTLAKSESISPRRKHGNIRCCNYRGVQNQGSTKVEREGPN